MISPENQQQHQPQLQQSQHQQQPNHVVATIENLPPEVSRSSSLSAPSSSSLRQRIRKVLNRSVASLPSVFMVA